MPLLPGAAPYSADGGPVGVLLCHVLSGCPLPLRPWAGFLAAAGATVRLALLPGHGRHREDLGATRWADWYAVVERELLLLRERCETVVVMGLSMGGTLALRLAEEQPHAVDGLALVNPNVSSARASIHPVPLRALQSVRRRWLSDAVAADLVLVRSLEFAQRLHTREGVRA